MARTRSGLSRCGATNRALYKAQELTCQPGTPDTGYGKLSQPATACHSVLHSLISVLLKFNLHIYLLLRIISLKLFSNDATPDTTVLLPFYLVMKKI